MAPRKKKQAPADADKLAVVKDEIVKKAKKQGFVDQKEIFEKIPDTEANVDVLDALHAELQDEGIEILSEDDEELNKDALEKAKHTAYLDDIADDSVRLYLREIGKIPLLTPEEELSIAKRVKAGDIKAKDEMAEANMRLVVSMLCWLWFGSVGPHPRRKYRSITRCREI